MERGRLLRQGHTTFDGWRSYLKREYWLYLMILPGIIYIVLFKYWPMYGISIAFRNYNVFKGFSDAPWIGMANFAKLFQRAAFMQALRNNVVISVLKLVLGFPASLILALMINEIRNSKARKGIQTAVILPNFVSWIVINGLMFALFNLTSGAVPGLLRGLGYTGQISNVMGDKDSFLWVIIISHIWKGAGMGTVVYLAAIVGIDQELYEAAQIDGAGKLRQLWHITLSSIRSTIVVLLIFRVGEMMYAGFDQIFAIQSPPVISVSEIIDTYVYKLGMESRKFSEATAAGLFQSVIGLVLVLVTNWVAKRIDHESGIM